MKLFYTGSQTFLGAQNSSMLSLGGFPSSSQVPVEGIDQLFGSISQQDLRNGSTLTKAVVLKNNTGAQVSGASIFYQNKSQFPVTTFRIALVALTYNVVCDEYSMEEISSGLDKPLFATFVDCNEQENALNLPTIPSEGFVGIWIERKVNSLRGSKSLSDEFLLNAFDIDPINHVAKYTFNGIDVVGKYFTLETIENQYVIWFDDGTSQFPQLAGNYELLIVNNIVIEDTPTIIASKVSAKLKSIIDYRGETITTNIEESIIVTNQKAGKVSVPTITSSDIEYQVVTQGLSDSLEQIETAELILQY